MATIIKRVWYSRGATGHRVKRVAYGYTLQVDGKQARKTDAGWTREQAEAELAARLLDRDTPPASVPSAPRAFAAVAQEYLEYKRGKGKRSLRDDEDRLKRLTAFFGADTPLGEITAHRIAQYDRDRVTHQSCRKTLISPSTVNRELALLRHLLRLAEEWGYIEKTPRIRLGREPQGRLRFLTEAEIARLLEACATRARKSAALLPVVTLALNTGMRKGEILGLEWARIDFARGILRLEETKTSTRREVPMNRAVYDALQPLYAAAQGELPAPAAGERRQEPQGRVFRKRTTSRAWGDIRTAFEAARREAGLDDFRFHDLRHTCASWLVMRGRHLKEVQEILGHRQLSMTNRYAHLSPDRLRDAVASLEDFSTRSAQSGRIPGIVPRKSASALSSDG